MKFKKYLLKEYEVEISDNIENIPVINEVTTVTGGDIAFNVPKINKEKYRKLNKRTNRMKNFKKTKFYKTDIPPEERTFKNLPRYANKKPICRFQDWLCIDGDHSYGKSPNGKHYGWSHRSVGEYYVGQTIKKGYIAIKKGKQLPYTIKSDSDAKWHAIEHARQVS